MIPRLNRQARQHLAHATLHGKRRGFRVWRAASRPSPAEKRKSRRSLSRHRLGYRTSETLKDATLRIRFELQHDAVMEAIGSVLNHETWPEHRGTTAQQLTAMHLEAEYANP